MLLPDPTKVGVFSTKTRICLVDLRRNHIQANSSLLFEFNITYSMTIITNVLIDYSGKVSVYMMTCIGSESIFFASQKKEIHGLSEYFFVLLHDYYHF